MVCTFVPSHNFCATTNIGARDGGAAWKSLLDGMSGSSGNDEEQGLDGLALAMCTQIEPYFKSGPGVTAWRKGKLWKMLVQSASTPYIHHQQHPTQSIVLDSLFRRNLIEVSQNMSRYATNRP